MATTSALLSTVSLRSSATSALSKQKPALRRSSRLTVSASSPINNNNSSGPVEDPTAPVSEIPPLGTDIKTNTFTPLKVPSFSDVMNFGGLGPETVNGRAAMLGFVTAIATEAATGKTVWTQLADNPFPFVIMAAITAAASFIPMTQAMSKESQAYGPFQVSTEMINGRAAMLGFAALLVTEAISKAPVF
eukprot:jgi/Chlat1/6673/Chrsp49S06161